MGTRPRRSPQRLSSSSLPRRATLHSSRSPPTPETRCPNRPVGETGRPRQRLVTRDSNRQMEAHRRCRPRRQGPGTPNHPNGPRQRTRRHPRHGRLRRRSAIGRTPSHRARPQRGRAELRDVTAEPASTNPQQRLHGGVVITLDDDTQRRAALQDPRGFVERATGASPLIIDEVQLAPPLFGALKAAVDRDRGPGRYVVTGSTRLLTADGFADALVGRLEVVEVLALSQGELGGGDDGFVEWAFSPRTDVVEVGDLSRYDYARLVACGGFPESPPATTPAARDGSADTPRHWSRRWSAKCPPSNASATCPE